MSSKTESDDSDVYNSFDPFNQLTDARKKQLKEESSIYEDMDSKLSTRKDISIFKLFYEIAKQIRPGVPIYRILAPPILISPLSSLERTTDGFYPNKSWMNVVDISDPFERFLEIVKWKMFNFAVSYHKYFQRGLKNSKPFNPILGELFECYWDHCDGSRTYFMGEQVSHHPPVSAYYLENKELGVRAYGNYMPKVTMYMNSFKIDCIGRNFLEIERFGEVYEQYMPPALISNVFFGRRIEHDFYEFFQMKCEQSGYECKVEFLSRANNKIKGYVRNKRTNKVIYKIEGALDNEMYFVKENKKILIADGSNKILEKLNLKKQCLNPLSKQSWNESRRNWHDVAYSIFKEDYNKAGENKYIIETRQRILRKKREKGEIEKFEPKYFDINEQFDEYKEWKFNEQKIHKRWVI